MNSTKNNSVNPIVAGVTGIVVGAGMAAAAAVALGDKKNRKKVEQAFNAVKDQAKDYVGNLQKDAEDKGKEVKEKVKEVKSK